VKQPLRPLLVTFALAIGSFFASTIYSQHSARAIDDANASIIANALPSIERLAGARAALIRLRREERRSLFEPEKYRDAVLEARQVLESQLSSYLTVPFYSNEESLWMDAHEKLDEVNRLLTLVGSQRQPTLQTMLPFVLPVGEALDSLDGALKTLVSFNVLEASREAGRARTLHARRERTELALDTFAALLTVTVGLLAVRTVRHYATLLEQRNRLQQTRAEELEQFAGRVAHDIRGPLANTSLIIELCVKETPSEQMRAMLGRGMRSLRRVDVFVEGLLRFARAGAQPESDDEAGAAPVIAEILAELEPLAAEQKIELRAEPIPDEAVACNAGVLCSVIENLVRNAIKFMGDAPLRTVVVRAAVRGDRMRFEVEDTGPGIAPELLPRVFDPYVRGRVDGTLGIGLGLATVRRIVEAHGGKVAVQSSPRGSLFSFELPRLRSGASGEHAARG
jgi:signal transduction histidine kinase